MLTLYDAARCPYCARVRILLAEKGIEYETVAIDLATGRPGCTRRTRSGKVPVIEEDAFVLPESAVIMEYLEERYPEPALLPADPAGVGWLGSRCFASTMRSATRTTRSAAVRTERGSGSTDCRLADSSGVDGDFGLVEIAYVPWLVRLRDAPRRGAAPRESPRRLDGLPSARRSRPSSTR